MTKIKLCGLSRLQDIEMTNQIKPDYIGFVFAKKSKRYVSFETATMLKNKLNAGIQTVGVFMNEAIDNIILSLDIVDVIQLHGNENNEYIRKLKTITKKPIIQAFVIQSQEDVRSAEKSLADFILLDGGKGEGKIFNWNFLTTVQRPYFLAGGLNTENVAKAVQYLQPYAVDVSTGVETDGRKDKNKMTAFVHAVRKGN
ncbi:MAG: phosphoribosylanthranilate isomerase [Clostridia bacterium]|nr:phosphoribosylanthranilate isomerase [Clostridia bacterium]